MEPNKRAYDFLEGGEVEVLKEGKKVFRPAPPVVQAPVEPTKKKKPRNAKAPEKVVPKVYVNLQLKNS